MGLANHPSLNCIALSAAAMSSGEFVFGSFQSESKVMAILPGINNVRCQHSCDTNYVKANNIMLHVVVLVCLEIK